MIITIKLNKTQSVAFSYDDAKTVYDELKKLFEGKPIDNPLVAPWPGSYTPPNVVPTTTPVVPKYPNIWYSTMDSMNG